MDFSNFREMSVKISKDRNYKKLRMPSGKRLLHSVSGRHYDDLWRKVSGIFRESPKVFLSFPIFPNVLLSLPNSSDPCYLKQMSYTISEYLFRMEIISRQTR